MRRAETKRTGLKARLLNLLFPPRCVLCRTFLDGGEALLCPACAARYAPGTRALRPSGGSFFGGCVAVLPYGAAREAIRRYKFGGKSGLSRPFGLWLADAVRVGYPALPFDVVTWAPVSRKRLRQRGYDQARLLAERLAAELGLSCVQLLEKTADTPAQSGLRDPARRRANVAGVYRAKPGAAVAGRRILLVDDVFTTGSTLSECARTLLMAGAERVDCAALAAKLP